MLLSDSNHAIASCGEVQQLFEPIASLGFNYFRFMRLFADSSRIILSTDPVWTTHFFEKQFYRVAWFDNKQKEYYSSGVTVWDQKAVTDDNLVGVSAREGFDMFHGLTIAQEFKDYFDFFDFTTPKDNSLISDNYEPLLEILQHFCFYFKERGVRLIKHAENNRIEIPSNHLTMVNKPNLKKIDDVKSMMRVSRYYVENTYLTNKEVEVIKFAASGASAKVIAISLGLSYRTVQGYLEQARNKLGCQNLISLISKCIKYGLVDSHRKN